LVLALIACPDTPHGRKKGHALSCVAYAVVSYLRAA
jgi:hypothetical protein